MLRFSLIWDALKGQLEVWLHITTVKRCKEIVSSHFSPLRMKDWVIFQPTDYERRLGGKIALLPKTKSPLCQLVGKSKMKSSVESVPVFQFETRMKGWKYLGLVAVLPKLTFLFLSTVHNFHFVGSVPNFPV